MKSLTIKKETVDWLKIIKLALKKKDWGKKYTLYKYGDTVLSCIMKTFDFEENVATFKLTLDYKNRELYWNNEDLKYYLNNFTIEDFKMHLRKKIKTLFDYCIEKDTLSKAELKYKKYKYYQWRISEDDIENYEPQALDMIRKIENNSLKLDMLNDLKVRVVRNLNVPYETMVKNYKNKYPIKIKGYNQIIADLED